MCGQDAHNVCSSSYLTSTPSLGDMEASTILHADRGDLQSKFAPRHQTLRGGAWRGLGSKEKKSYGSTPLTFDAQASRRSPLGDDLYLLRLLLKHGASSL
jgi:hypothetical protein